MKKLLFTIVLPLTMVCCKSENVEQEFEEINQPIEEVEKDVDCLVATIVNGKLATIEDYWNDIIGIDGYKIAISKTTQFHHYCFDKSKYTYNEMYQIVTSKYVNK